MSVAPRARGVCCPGASAASVSGESVTAIWPKESAWNTPTGAGAE